MLRPNRDQHCMLERWKIATLAKFELLLKIAGEVVMPRELDRRTKRCVGLNENLAGRFTAAGSARHLSEQLECPLARSEVRQMQREVGVDDADQGHVWKIQTFRDHLRSNENVDLARSKISQRFAISVLACH